MITRPVSAVVNRLPVKLIVGIFGLASNDSKLLQPDKLIVFTVSGTVRSVRAVHPERIIVEIDGVAIVRRLIVVLFVRSTILIAVEMT
jgi:hypothetical protein